jgi:hypothetical protein
MNTKFTNLNAHECHMLMTQFPVALRGVLPENVRLVLVKPCAFLNAISQKAVDPRNLSKLQNYVVQCLVNFELAFSTFLLQYYSPGAPCERDYYSRSSIPAQHMAF